jgi:hypothetical protein
MTDTGSASEYSSSVQAALDWASAVARVRERTPPGANPPRVVPADLFVGLLLAHADTDGEVQVLLDHFGLTARDVVGEDYERVSTARLAGALPYVSQGTQQADGPGLREIFSVAATLLHVLGGL